MPSGLNAASGCMLLRFDLHGAYAKVDPHPGTPSEVCADPFDVIKLANTALDETHRARS